MAAWLSRRRVHPGKGPYAWLNNNKIAEAPPWLLQLVTKKPQPPQATPRFKNGPPADMEDELLEHFDNRLLPVTVPE